MSIIAETKEKMGKALEHLQKELSGIRTGKANPALLESVMVNVYDTKMRLKELATISSPEPRQLMVTSFDGSNTPKIAKAIEQANLGLVPIVEGSVIRLKIPTLDAKVRGDMVKLCHKKREEAKVNIRNIRREFNDKIKKQKESGEVGEDIMKKTEKSIQELTDKYCKDADQMTTEKEQDLVAI